MFDIQNLKEPLLHVAALSPFIMEQAGRLTEKGKRRCSVRGNWFVECLLIVTPLIVFVVVL